MSAKEINKLLISFTICQIVTQLHTRNLRTYVVV